MVTDQQRWIDAAVAITTQFVIAKSHATREGAAAVDICIDHLCEGTLAFRDAIAEVPTDLAALAYTEQAAYDLYLRGVGRHVRNVIHDFSKKGDILVPRIYPFSYWPVRTRYSHQLVGVLYHDNTIQAWERIKSGNEDCDFSYKGIPFYIRKGRYPQDRRQWLILTEALPSEPSWRAERRHWTMPANAYKRKGLSS